MNMPQPLPAVCAGALWRLPCRLTAALSRRTPCAAARSSPRRRTATTFAPFIAHTMGGLADFACVYAAAPCRCSGPVAQTFSQANGNNPQRRHCGSCYWAGTRTRRARPLWLSTRWCTPHPLILPKGFVLRTPQRSLALPPMCCHSVRRHPCVVHTPTRLLASPLSTAPNTRGPLRPWVCIAIAGHGAGVG